jgi:lipopolysaccharide export system protein LptA
MTRKFVVSAAVLAMLAGPTQVAHAQQTAVDIEANEMEILDADKKAIFRGTVVAVRGTDTIKSDEMVVDYADTKQADGTSKSEVSKLDATGHVTIVTKSQVITGTAAMMNIKANTLLVTGDVKVVQGKTVLRGQKLNVDLNLNKTVMSGGRVKGSFVPK